MASDIVARQTKTEPAARRGSEAHLDGDDYFPTTENVNTMLDLLEGQGEDRGTRTRFGPGYRRILGIRECELHK